MGADKVDGVFPAWLGETAGDGPPGRPPQQITNADRQSRVRDDLPGIHDFFAAFQHSMAAGLVVLRSPGILWQYSIRTEAGLRWNRKPPGTLLGKRLHDSAGEADRHFQNFSR